VPFRDITGHRRLVSLLSRAVARGSLPPALLLAGPAGVGKRRAALAVAEALNCLAPLSLPELEHDACGECASCRRIGRGAHPDVVVLEPGDTGSIKIEVIRDVVDRSAYRPFEGKRRVVVIDEADAMVPQAQSALLKTLEEPPPASVFILLSSLPDDLLPTVRSRCPRLRFSGLSPADIAAVLMADPYCLPEEEARALAADADGSLGQALSVQSVDVTEARAAAEQLLALVARSSDPAGRVEAAGRLMARKESAPIERARLASCLRAMAALLRDLGIVAVRADARGLANTDLRPDLDRLASAFDTDRCVSAYAAVDRALAAIERNVSPKVVADWLVLQL